MWVHWVAFNLEIEFLWKFIWEQYINGINLQSPFSNDKKNLRILEFCEKNWIKVIPRNAWLKLVSLNFFKKKKLHNNSSTKFLTSNGIRTLRLLNHFQQSIKLYILQGTSAPSSHLFPHPSTFQHPFIMSLKHSRQSNKMKKV